MMQRSVANYLRAVGTWVILISATPSPSASSAFPGEVAGQQETNGPIAQQLSALRTSFDHPLLGDADIDAGPLLSFYQGRQFRPFWIEGRHARAGARHLIATLRSSGQDGLDPAAFPTDELEHVLLNFPKADEATLAAWDILMSQSLASYVHDLRYGRAAPSITYTDAQLQPVRKTMLELLKEASSAPSVVLYLQGLHARNPIYARFRKALARYRIAAVQAKPVKLPLSRTLRHGDEGAAVAKLRERLGALSDGGIRAHFGPELDRAVRDFQRAHRLKVDGVVGPRTLAMLNQSMPDRMRKIIINMERARWLPENLGERFLLVDTAGFELRMFEKGQQVDTMRVVVGKEYHRTPSFADSMEYVVLNPYWNVPQSILRKEVAPSVLRNGPGYLAASNMEVLSRWAGHARVLPAARVNWRAVANGEGGVRVRQKPGPRNALGRVKFIFPNRFAVYLHDTPAGHLFERSYRAFSHGSIRVARPLDLAGFVLGGAPGWSRERIEAEIAAGKRRRIDLPAPIPVYISYFTAWPRQDGTVSFRSDVYDRDADLEAQL